MAYTLMATGAHEEGEALLKAGISTIEEQLAASGGNDSSSLAVSNCMNGAKPVSNFIHA